MGINNNDLISIEIKSFREKIKFNFSKYHIILKNNSGKGFEFDYETEMISPFNSILWFYIDNKEFAYFIEYFKEKINDMVSKEDKKGCIGYLLEDYYIINLDSIIDFIIKDKSCKNEDKLISSFKDFYKYIFSLYDKLEYILSRDIQMIKKFDNFYFLGE